MSSIAVVVINWNSAAHTRNCLLSLQSVTTEHAVDVLVLDNASSEAGFDQLESDFPDVRFYRSKRNLGFAGGNNFLLEIVRKGDWDYFLLLNNDTFVEEKAIDLLVASCDTNDKKITQPLILFNDDREKVWNAGGRLDTLSGNSTTIGYRENKDQFTNRKEYKIDWYTGCSVMAPTSLLRETNLFNPHFFLYHEDVESSIRLRKLGYDLALLPTSRIYHVAGGSGKQTKSTGKQRTLPIIHYYNIRNSLWVVRLYPGVFHFTALVYQVLKGLALLGYFLLRFRFEKARSAIFGLSKGLFYPLASIR
ncbi:MAG: glycosyltransferase family 2 protein [Cyclobacteriaceae bacterium]